MVTSVEHFVTFLGHVVFLLLTRPNAHNKNFPYHVRTTQIGILEAMDAAGVGYNPRGGGGGGGGGSGGANGGGNGALSNGNVTTLDAFAHGGSYSVTEHTTAMDIFTVDTVGSRRQYSPAVPPPYSAAAAAAANVPSSAAAAAARSSPTWAESSRRRNSAAAAVNGVAGRRNQEAGNGGAKIYDPNDDDEEE